MKSKVTVLTPTYNCAPFVGQTIRSVLSQKYPNLEHIVIDDGSTDDTPEVLSQYKGVPGVTLIRHANMGEHLTINKGLQMVTGEYFIILNADDLLLSDAVNTLVGFMDVHPDVLCAYPDISIINEDGSIRQKELLRPEYDFKYMVRYHNCLPSVGAIFRGSVIQSVGLRDVHFRWASDYDYWLRIGLTGSMCRVPGVYAAWRHRDGQLSAAGSKDRAAERERLMKKFFSFDVPREIRSVEAEALSWMYLVAAQLSSSFPDKMRYVTKALTTYPLQTMSIHFWNALRVQALCILRQ